VPDKLQGKRIAFLVAPEGVEQVELTEPWKAVESEGARPELVSLEQGEIQAFNHLDRRVRARLLRAGQAGRRDLPRPVTLVEADVLRGRTITSWPSLQTDIRNAGGTWVDEEVVVDEGLVSSRNPDDLPAFCAKIVEEFCEGKHAGQRQSVGSAS
jgi:protease I